MVVCERGTMFGYNDLVVDPRNLVLMRDAGCLVSIDITHALQQPAGRPLQVLTVESKMHGCDTFHTLCAGWRRIQRGPATPYTHGGAGGGCRGCQRHFHGGA